MTLLKNTLLSLLAIGGASVSSMAMADDFGCKAVLCFAGGKGLSECAPTISEVKKRLAKGKPFPSCAYQGPQGSANEIVQQSGRYTNTLGKDNNICPDGTRTDWWRKKKGWACNEITVTFIGANSDGSNMVQRINW